MLPLPIITATECRKQLDMRHVSPATEYPGGNSMLNGESTGEAVNRRSVSTVTNLLVQVACMYIRIPYVQYMYVRVVGTIHEQCLVSLYLTAQSRRPAGQESHSGAGPGNQVFEIGRRRHGKDITSRTFANPPCSSSASSYGSQTILMVGAEMSPMTRHPLGKAPQPQLSAHQMPRAILVNSFKQSRDQSRSTSVRLVRLAPIGWVPLKHVDNTYQYE